MPEALPKSLTTETPSVPDTDVTRMEQTFKERDRQALNEQNKILYARINNLAKNAPDRTEQIAYIHKVMINNIKVGDLGQTTVYIGALVLQNEYNISYKDTIEQIYKMMNVAASADATTPQPS